MNVGLTNRCNFNCPFCFARDAMSISRAMKQDNEISMDSIGKVIRFLKKSGQDTFNMIGGEPTLHSRFRDIYEKIESEGLAVSVFSNGLMREGIAEFLRERKGLNCVLINILEPRHYTKELWGALNRTLSVLKDKAVLSFRIYETAFRIDFLIALIDRHCLCRVVNLAPACPSLKRENAFLKIEDHKRVSERLLRYSYRFRQRRITWYSDNGFIYCAFTRAQLKGLYANVGFIPACVCLAPVEVAPNLTVFRCFGMAEKSDRDMKLTDFSDLASLERFFDKRTSVLKRAGLKDECLYCDDMEKGNCDGGCAVHIIKRFPGYKTAPVLYKQ